MSAVVSQILYQISVASNLEIPREETIPSYLMFMNSTMRFQGVIKMISAEHLSNNGKIGLAKRKTRRTLRVS